ncbi:MULTISPECIES: hypothetical protein [Bacteroides]|jgi:hypothetical protein|uniref:TM2 domain-containing protein n=1 Tax=Bacteroides hominis TaxID=2763023 RepID=A0ABU4A6U0_9BACE|nr:MULTISPECIES: hypothetical protein [Bacteroides]CCZ39973.1 unknown [Bacteroides fragilis CAG:558]MBA5650836.1 hypothetical protein [Bacteroides fragilis]MCE9401883.1 hypothetical protein [Bacteroides fragilis]MCZ2501377.1 hypothetical protein [Bacteroides fragilis]MCZ2663058.1 hypothetical protein [Bacteroides fragilis]
MEDNKSNNVLFYKNDLLDNKSKNYREETGKCSDICRYIVFALMALLWGMYNKDGVFIITFKSVLFLGVLMVYLVIDILQYFLVALFSRHDLCKFKQGIQLQPGEKLTQIIIQQEDRNSKISYLLFFHKIILLLLSCIGIGIGLIME